MFRTKTIKQLAAAVPLLALAGCGGSSGVSNGYPNPPANTLGNPVGPGVNGGSAMAIWSVGNTWKYQVAGTITQDYLTGSGSVQTLSGQITSGTFVRVITAAAPPPYAAGTFEVTDTFTYTLPGSVPIVQVSTNYFTQANDGSIHRVGADQYLIQTQDSGTNSTYYPGTFSTSLNIASNVQGGSYNPSVGAGTSAFTDAFTVLDQVSVPASTGSPFTTWKTTSTETQTWIENGGTFVFSLGELLDPGFVINSTQNRSITEWWVPSIGAPVKAHWNITGTQTDNTSYSINATLKEIVYATPVNLGTSEQLDMVLVSRS